MNVGVILDEGASAAQLAKADSILQSLPADQVFSTEDDLKPSDIVERSNVLIAVTRSKRIHTLCRHSTCAAVRYARKRGVPVFEVTRKNC